MFPNSSLRKLVQISEEALPSVHAPFIFGNVLYVLTQKDFRKTEDTRVFSLSKVMPNGDLQVVSPQETEEWLQHLPKQGNLLHNQQMLFSLLQLLNSANNSQQEYPQQALPQPQQQYSTINEMPYPQPMETSSTPVESNRNLASIEQQLQWNNCKNTSLPLPMHYSQGTSTTEIDNEQQGRKDQQTMAMCSCCKMSQQCRIRKKLYTKSTNTQELLKSEPLDAREQLKMKKMSYFCT